MFLKSLKNTLRSTEKTVVCSYKEFTGMCQHKQVALLSFEISENIYGTEGQRQQYTKLSAGQYYVQNIHHPTIVVFI